jgi:hypothetical protein
VEEAEGTLILPVAEALKGIRPGEPITSAWMDV